MQIDPKLTTGAVGWVGAAQAVARRGNVAADKATFADTEALNNELHKVPDVRSDAVAKAKALVAQASWPPAETIKRLANLLAMQLSNDHS